VGIYLTPGAYLYLVVEVVNGNALWFFKGINKKVRPAQFGESVVHEIDPFMDHEHHSLLNFLLDQPFG
jgi:hypothetical protein